MTEGVPKEPTSEEQAKIEEMRTMEDAKLIMEGAEYSIDKDKEKRLVLTAEQIAKKKREYWMEKPEVYGKFLSEALTPIKLPFNEHITSTRWYSERVGRREEKIVSITPFEVGTLGECGHHVCIREDIRNANYIEFHHIYIYPDGNMKKVSETMETGLTGSPNKTEQELIRSKPKSKYSQFIRTLNEHGSSPFMMCENDILTALKEGARCLTDRRQEEAKSALEKFESEGAERYQ